MQPLHRRHWLLCALALSQARPAQAAASDAEVRPGRVLHFPRDHGAHLGARTEWWYATGWLGGSEAAPTHGFQLTFFRSRTGLAEGNPSRFSARQLLFAHAAVTDLAAQRHRHAQRIARWSGEASPTAPSQASTTEADVRLAGWTLRRDPATGAYAARLATDGLANLGIELGLAPTQPLLLQGEAGFSRKGPEVSQASLYYSEPQLAVHGALTLDGRRTELQGRGWLDREWSDSFLAPDAVGWDWIGINLFDGRALTAFVLRRADGSPLWAGGSVRAPGGPVRAFAAGEVRFTPGRRWASPATQAQYPVAWQIDTPAGRFDLRALMDAQELDGRTGTSTGAVYWEGLAELLQDSRRVGLGYLEMTGYAGRLTL